jgi:C-terminal processing protease CtpA/Prc
LFTLVAYQACGGGSPKSQVQLRDLTPDEARADFQQIVEGIRNLYGPLEFKERRYNYKFEDLVSKSLEELKSAKTDVEVFGVYARFLAKLDDGHVSIRFPTRSTLGYNRVTIPVIAEPLDGKAIVTQIGDPTIADLGVGIGDEIVSVDGKTPAELLTAFVGLEGMANDASRQHLFFRIFNRRNFSGELFPTASDATVVLRKPDGAELQVVLTWRRTNDLGRVVSGAGGPASLSQTSLVAPLAAEINETAGLAKIGSPTPFFLTPQARQAFQFSEVKPSAEMLAKYSLKERGAPKIYASLFRHENKTILLVRQPGYSPETFPEVARYLNAYRAILDQYESVADVLVIDQTLNPGGYLDYCQGFAQLFLKESGPGFMQAFNTDRKWIQDYRAWAQEIDTNLSSEASLRMLSNSERIERDYDSGLSITDPIPFYGQLMIGPDKSYTWKKPVLVLADELAGSCGDVFPMLVKANGAATLFGERTWGLGGNVESFTLNYSLAQVSLTRGLFAAYKGSAGSYDDALFVENNGVTPDIPHQRTLEDFRKGYVDYVKAFSDAAIKLVP